MWKVVPMIVIALAVGLACQARADDLTGADRFLYAGVQATAEQVDNFKKAFSVCL